ncbi:hypothetical protein GA0070607_3983 [Micromonospora coriariae]|uniref:Lipoprotein n=1 Tax=Micromonospora coriariae TaxID=285665 RepID=A0A1C4WQ88_9ACTN|nr:hypothetical protein GA0070607_3983 [Micromonospora coriariae]
MERRYAAATLSLSLAALLTACTSSASRDEQMEYLHKMAQRGAEAHAVYKSQGDAGDPDKCESAYRLYSGPQGNDAPDVGNYDEKIAFLKEGERLFMGSCMSGTPSPVSARSKPASPSAPPASRATT